MIDPAKIIEYKSNFWLENGFAGYSNCYENVRLYIENYPSQGKTFVIAEEDYIDKNFLIDYVNFYSRCFDDLRRKTVRYHFFHSETKEKLLELLNFLIEADKTNIAKKRLNECYIGFIVKKPLSNHVIGRTILKKYPEIGVEGNPGEFRVYSSNDVHFYGLPLEVEALPFQEQDRAVSACATVAIWTALQSLERRFQISVPLAPSEITNLAFESNSFVTSTKFPNEGLNLYQIISIFRNLGYEVIPYRQVNDVDKDFLSNLITAYMTYGLPLIALLKIIDNQNHVDGHAVVISGYNYDNQDDRILRLYIHDDQIGPYSKVTFFDDSLFENAVRELHRDFAIKISNNICLWQNEWLSKYNSKHVILENIFIPIYPKIRLGFAGIYERMNILKNNLPQIANHKVRGFLSDTNKYKYELIHKILPLARNKNEGIKILNTQLPRFFWVIRIEINEEIVRDIIFDATTNEYSSRPFVINFR
jgi:hypothetical protein